MQLLSPWYWRSLPLAHRTGSEVFECLFLSQATTATLLESPYPPPPDYPYLARYSLCAGEPRLLGGYSRQWTPQLGEILPFLRNLTQENFLLADCPQHLPFVGGWLGWLGYDLAWEIEKLPYFKPDLLPFPLAYWYEPAAFAIADHHEQILWLATTTEAMGDVLESRLASPTLAINLSPSASELTFCTQQEEYEAAVRQAKTYIEAGDIFQANLSVRFQAQTQADSWAIYRTLTKINPSPFASYWRTVWGDIISCSPERLITLQGKQAQTRPIAGTRPRGTSRQTEQELLTELLVNVKERAEHIMLVDLERNDLGRVCEWGSVQVDELLTIERYSHVMHLVSNIKGTLRSDRDAVDLIRSLFPGGTITGCPKVRCLEIIEELEPLRRNLFYGSCGYLDYRGNLDLNILIRTLLYPRSVARLKTVWGQVGAGIVADSDPQKEWWESLQKAQAQLAALKING